MYTDGKNNLQNSVISTLVDIILNTEDASANYTEILDSMPISQEKKEEIRPQASFGRNRKLRKKYRAIIKAVAAEKGTDAKMKVILDVLLEIRWIACRDTILAVEWHKIPGLKEAMTPKVPVDSETVGATQIFDEVDEPPQPCSASTSTSVVVSTANSNRPPLGNPVHEVINPRGSEEIGGLNESEPLKSSGETRPRKISKRFDTTRQRQTQFTCILFPPIGGAILLLKTIPTYHFAGPHMDRSDTSTNSYSTTEMPRSLCKVNPSVKLDDTYFPVNATELLPDWNKTILDLCHDPETILIVTVALIQNKSQEIRCPERSLDLAFLSR
ncbi:hypothetical protein Fcan01_26859 [Folsomia candida]|uniref:Uncharacterized protein n=2 Tax=Folsomia candida TaxID=158441 RepID=A0A226D0S2_FOLCA|nr:hypothetical protein Fcan01_26859 [Folsomia candida]